MDWPLWIASAALFITSGTLIWRAGHLEGAIVTRVQSLELNLVAQVGALQREMGRIDEAKLDQRLSRVEARLEMLGELLLANGERRRPQGG